MVGRPWWALLIPDSVARTHLFRATPLEVRRVDTSLESHSTKIEGRRIEGKTRQGLDATNKPQRLAYRQSGASEAD